MALTRKLLKSLGLEDAVIDSIIEEHVNTVDGLRADVEKYKADAEKLPGIQKELDTIKAGDFEAKYNTEHSAFEEFKTSVAQKEARAAKENAVRSYFQEHGIKGDALDIAMRGSNAEVDALELDGDKIKDTTTLDALVSGTFKSLVKTKEGSGRVNTGGKLDNEEGGEPEPKSLADALKQKYNLKGD